MQRQAVSWRALTSLSEKSWVWIIYLVGLSATSCLVMHVSATDSRSTSIRRESRAWILGLLGLSGANCLKSHVSATEN
ncbi:hypothetical protein EFS30_12730 [Levilactobacillus parabrevis]|nr:hypothetical protein [Levilactobacillus parabrevis]MCT4491446.1 hypothetical protein [Levilactobacillus parabrevis]